MSSSQQVKNALFVLLFLFIHIVIYSQTNWLQGGNTLGTTGILGTLDSNHLDFYTKNARQGRWTASGNFLLGSITDNGSKFQVTGSSAFMGAFTQSGGKVTFGNGLLLDKFPGDGVSARLISDARMFYQSNNTLLQHLFSNQIGTAFTGTLVQLDPGNWALQDSQLSLNVLGRQGNSGLSVNMLGNTGLGITTPTARLHVAGTVRFSSLAKDNSKVLILAADTSGNLCTRDASSLGSGQAWALTGNTAVNASTTFLGTMDTSSVSFRTNNVEQLRITASGNIGIGTSAPQSKLAVKGTITAQKLIATQLNWADYVFRDDYRLPSLDSVASYIRVHRHLPEIPCEEEVQKKGLDVGANQALLLKKIEELTLYVIDQQKQIADQHLEIELLKKQLKKTEELNARIDDLKRMLTR